MHRFSDSTSPTLTRRSVMKGATASACMAMTGGMMTGGMMTGGMMGRGFADPVPPIDSVAPSYSDPVKTKWRFGVTIDTPVTFTNGLATFPVPMNWPEQSVRVLAQSSDPRVTNMQIRELDGGAKQIVLSIARMLSGSDLTVQFDVEIAKSNTLPPTHTDSLEIPAKIDRPLKSFMGNSPNIDATHVRVRQLTKELTAGEPSGAWAKVRQIYEAVRERVAYTEGPIRNASDALADGKGDCEDMTSLFVALCRNARIPARMVWIPGHCYPEFYLEQPSAAIGEDAVGFWYPCQAAGSDQFGQMEEQRPILQKGDRFKIPESRGPVRYVSEFFRCDRVGSGSPRFNYVREPILDPVG